MIIIRNASGLENKIKISYDPMSDFMQALDLLSSPEHQPIHLEWATDVLNSLSRRDKIKLFEVKNIIDRYIKLDLFLSGFVAKTSYPIDELWDHLNNTNNWKPAKDNYDPLDFIPFLTYMWSTYIKPVVISHWDDIKKQIFYGKKLLKDGNYQNLLQSINERIKISKNTLSIQKWYEMDVDQSDICSFSISPLIFVFPYLVMDWIEDKGLFFLGWETAFKGNDSTAKGIDIISNKTFALSDKSRLRMLLILNNRSMTQKDLGSYMGFAKSTTSKHVNILLKAEVLKRIEVDKSVYLSVNKESINNLSDLIIDWLS